MSDALSPYSAVLLASYGGPRQPEDVLPFMRNATAGRGVPDERLLEVSQHYQLFGGRSPINEQNETIQLTIFWLTRLAIFLLSSLSEALSIPHELSGQYSNPTISVGVATRIDQLVIELTI